MIVCLVLTISETDQSEAVIPMACVNIATRSDRNRLSKALCFKLQNFGSK